MRQNFKDNMLSNYDLGQPNKWDGTEADGSYQNTSTMKPVYPDCDLPNQHQFAESVADELFGGRENYIGAKFDKFNNVVPESRPFAADNATPQEGQSGRLMFADGSDSAGSKPDDFTGFNVIEYSTGPAFQQASSVTVDNSRADRGRES